MRGAQKKDEKITAIISQIRNGKETKFTENEDGVLYYKDRVCVPNDSELKKAILEEAHSRSFAMHPGSTKMYQDLKVSYWWFGMKRDVSEFVTVFSVSKSEGRASSFFRISSLLEYRSGNGTESPWILWLGYH